MDCTPKPVTDSLGVLVEVGLPPTFLGGFKLIILGLIFILVFAIVVLMSIVLVKFFISLGMSCLVSVITVLLLLLLLLIVCGIH